jgi:hypothetical protein
LIELLGNNFDIHILFRISQIAHATTAKHTRPV